MKDENEKERFQKRIKERRLWFRTGVLTLGVSIAIFVIAVIGFFLNLPFNSVYYSLGVSVSGIAFGVVCTVLFSRLGWSQSIMVDFLLNRLSIVLILVGFGLELLTIFPDINYFPKASGYGFGFLALGVVLALVGVRTQTELRE